MAGIIYAPFAAGMFFSAAIILPFIPSLILFCSPLLLTFLAIFNLNLDWINWWYVDANLTTLP